MNNSVKAILMASIFSAVESNATWFVTPGKVTHNCPSCGKEFKSFNKFKHRCDECKAKDIVVKPEKFKHHNRRKK